MSAQHEGVCSKCGFVARSGPLSSLMKVTPAGKTVCVDTTKCTERKWS